MEFEILSRDVLEKSLGLNFESFGQGADQGIDLRYAKGEGMIVQCKHYKDFPSLYQSLKAEVVKVIALKTRRYLITTSVSLSPEQKDKIKALFAPYIKDTGDIYGRSELNTAIRKYPEIEKNNYKLWLASTNVLERILHSHIINDSEFILQEIEEKLKFYVQNESFNEAMEVLEKNHYVVISGIPGIGKTSLAEMLCYDLLARNEAEFIGISNSTAEIITLFKPGIFQVFLFDDFLGSSFLNNNFQRNEDKQLLRLIKQVRNAPDKRLIFTTREYILNQAALKFESLADHSFAKCIVDLSRYNTEIKAKILYNHLYFNNIPLDYIKSLIDKKQLLKIIEHRNYSPRIIDWITANEHWCQYTPENFGESILAYFEEPLKIWQIPFENHITPLSRVILYCLLITGDSTTFDNLYKQVVNFCRKQNENEGLEIDIQSYKKGLRELDNSFIVTSKQYDHICINFQNPSIQDFLIAHVNSDSTLRATLIQASCFLKPILNIFMEPLNLWSQNRLNLDQKLIDLLQNKILIEFDKYGYHANPLPYVQFSNEEMCLHKLNIIDNNMQPSEGGKLYNLLKRKFATILYEPEIGFNGFQIYIKFFRKYAYYVENLDVVEILENLVTWIESDDDLSHFDMIGKMFPSEYDEFLAKDNPDYDMMLGNVASYLSDVHTGQIEDYHSSIKRLLYLESEFGYNTDEERNRLADEFNQSGRFQDYLCTPEPNQNDEFIEHSPSKSPQKTNSTKLSQPAKFSTKNTIEDIFRSIN